jgi:molybdopterin synthase catalytic subunit
MPVRVRVLFFARAREVAGVSEAELSLPDGAGTAALEAALVAAHPGLASVLESCVLAVNQEYVSRAGGGSGGVGEGGGEAGGSGGNNNGGGGGGTPLRDGDEVAIIPPLSGG